MATALCPQCDRRLPARALVLTTFETLVGEVSLERPISSVWSASAGSIPWMSLQQCDLANGTGALNLL